MKGKWSEAESGPDESLDDIGTKGTALVKAPLDSGTLKGCYVTLPLALATRFAIARDCYYHEAMMRHALICLCVAATGFAFAQPKKAIVDGPEGNGEFSRHYARSHALLIGVNTYDHLPREKQLNFALDDANDLAKCLHDVYGFEDVKILPNATKTQIEEALEFLGDKKNTSPDDRILVFFSGHGHTVKNTEGEKFGFWVPREADIDFSATDNLVPCNKSCVSMEFVWETLSGSNAKHVLVIADSCYSGLMVRLDKNTTVSSAYMEHRAMQGMTAGTGGQTAGEELELHHGIFTHFLLQQLEFFAKRGDSFTASTLWTNVKEPVVNHTDHIGSLQTPNFGWHFGDSSGEMVFTPIPAAQGAPHAFGAFGREEVDARGPFVASAPNESRGPTERAAQYDLLTLNPEYQEGLRLVRNGNFKAAIPILQKYQDTVPRASALVAWMEIQTPKLQPEAYLLFKKAAKKGDAFAKFYLGRCVYDGIGVAQDKEEGAIIIREQRQALELLANHDDMAAFALGRAAEAQGDFQNALKWYGIAAEEGNAVAMNNLGSLYSSGQGVAADYTKAHYWYHQSADLGYRRAMNNIGELYEDGHGVPEDPREALTWYRRAAGLGEEMALRNLGDLYKAGRGVPQDHATAVELYRKAVGLGDSGAMVNLGVVLSDAHESHTDYPEALRLFRRAADLGNVAAMGDMGWMYEHGHGVPNDNVEAFKWYRKAASMGGGYGMYNVGRFSEFGIVGKADPAEALRWYKQAAGKGYLPAMKRVAALRDQDSAGPADLAEAFKYHMMAAEKGDADSMRRVGEMLELGLGVEASRESALAWFRRASNAGDEGDAQSICSFLLSHEDFDNAYRLARELVNGKLKDKAEWLDHIAWEIVRPDSKLAKKDYDLALLAAQRAANLAQEDYVLDTLAWAYYRKGDASAAIETEKKAIALSTGASKAEYEANLKLMEGKRA